MGKIQNTNQFCFIRWRFGRAQSILVTLGTTVLKIRELGELGGCLALHCA